MKFKIGDRVCLTFAPKITGTIVSREIKCRASYGDCTLKMVELDNGFKVENGSIILSTITATPENLKLIERASD